MKSRTNILTALVFLFFLGNAANAQEHKYSCEGDIVAFDGNDLVSYFDNQVTKGKKEFSFEYDGLILYFSSDANLKKFKLDPDRFFPAYKGWCATAVANGNLYRPNFSQFKIQDNRLLFFEVRAFFNGKTAWDKNPEINQIVADKNFNKISAD